MKIEKEALFKFGPEPPKKELNQRWPVGSKFLKVMFMEDGIYSFFATPDLVTQESEIHTFILGGSAPGSVDPSDEFIDIIAIISDVPPAPGEPAPKSIDDVKQMVITFPIFKRYHKK